MENRKSRIDLVKFIKYYLKHLFLVILFAAAGFGAMYHQTMRKAVETYSAHGTMYVYTANPNMINYQYTSSVDLNSAVQLIDTYLVVVKSNKVMDVVSERLAKDYVGITPKYIASSLSMSSVSETGVVQVTSTTQDPRLSMDIVNAVLDVAPDEIIRVVNAGSIEVIDYATEPPGPNPIGWARRGMIGALGAGMVASILLLVLFLMNQKVSDASELTQSYKPPVLSSVKRIKKSSKDAGSYLLGTDSEMEVIESYSKLRMNLLYTMVGKESRTVIVTSAVAGEGKSTIAANLGISCAMSGKKVLLVDADLRRGCQQDIFHYESHAPGVSEVLGGMCTWQDAVKKGIRNGLDVLPAGQLPPNPSELLESVNMLSLLEELEEAYELVLLDMPPINFVSDPLAVSGHVAGCVFVSRQNFSDHRDIHKALISAEMTGMDVLGFVFYGEKVTQSSYYNRKYYKNYYHAYDYRHTPGRSASLSQSAGQSAGRGANKSADKSADKSTDKDTATTKAQADGKAGTQKEEAAEPKEKKTEDQESVPADAQSAEEKEIPASPEADPQ